jgi:hypothetical protein
MEKHVNTSLVIIFMSILGFWNIQIDPRSFDYNTCMKEKEQLEQRSTPKQVIVFCLDNKVQS